MKEFGLASNHSAAALSAGVTGSDTILASNDATLLDMGDPNVDNSYILQWLPPHKQPYQSTKGTTWNDPPSL
jgi:hypothetical protein